MKIGLRIINVRVMLENQGTVLKGLGETEGKGKWERIHLCQCTTLLYGKRLWQRSAVDI